VGTHVYMGMEMHVHMHANMKCVHVCIGTWPTRVHEKSQHMRTWSRCTLPLRLDYGSDIPRGGDAAIRLADAMPLAGSSGEVISTTPGVVGAGVVLAAVGRGGGGGATSPTVSGVWMRACEGV
jgi:hypothetical protein